MIPRLLVVDASAVVEVLRRSETGDAVASAMRDAAVAAPAHLDAEVLSALGRLERAGTTDSVAVDRALNRLTWLPVERYLIAPLVRRAWSLRGNTALRDGLYVAYAERLGATLLTVDKRLARSSPVPIQAVT